MYPLSGEDEPPLPPWRFSTELHCADCDIALQGSEPEHLQLQLARSAPARPAAASAAVIGVDYGLVIPDHGSVAARRARSSPGRPSPTRNARRICSSSRASAASRSTRRGATSTDAQRAWVLDGEGEWTKNVWYGVQALLRLARDQGVQDAHPRAAVALPLLHRMHGMRRRAAEARGAAVAARQSRASTSAK